ncbi:MAG: acylphosphatase [Gammaproteobacteria bacterium]|nr:acylphosphatase [Pseudomonadales bacterium]MCP5345961.1 acylphosphatase [Pseudomonadales bacterium]
MQGQKLTLHGFVAGRVQGVFFRAETRRKALELGLDGWVRNVVDGRVELLISGPPEVVDSMLAWLRHGPRLARVDALDLQPLDTVPDQGFIVEE